VARITEAAFWASILALVLAFVGAQADLPEGWAGFWGLSVWPLIVLFAALAVLRRRMRGRPGRGLLNDRPRPPLTDAERKVHVAFNMSQMLASRDKAPDHPLSLVTAEVARLDKLWKARRKGAPMSDDELRSVRLLYLYANPQGPVSAAENEALLADVADPAPLRALRQRIADGKARSAAGQDDYRAWLADVGNPAMDHLLADGWISFLTAQPAPDPGLWHQVATDFHDIEQDGRLEAAFWILSQPACDRATASDFIRGYAGGELLAQAAKAGRSAEIEAYAQVIRRYNAGFYRTFAERPEINEILSHYGPPYGPPDRQAVIAIFEKVEQSTGIAPLPRPEGLLAKGDTPTDTPGARSRFAYDSSEGLRLAYPGPGWRGIA
jgi:hypothetical protein